ncbi:MAG: serine/threonine-protein kinase [Myxococcota bacterium]
MSADPPGEDAPDLFDREPVTSSSSDPAAQVEDERLRTELRARLFGEPRSAVRIGEYEVLHKLGQGGTSTVFAVRDRQGRSRALKLVQSCDPRSLARLRREGRAMEALVHPHIVRMHQMGTHGDAVYVVFDLIEGVALQSWLRSARSWRETLACLLPVLDGLASAHALGILHRDLKPENILVQPPSHAWLLDFGLALPLPGSDAQALTHMSQALTRTGAVLGTVGYIAPEHLLGQPLDARADQFSICVVLWQALYGQAPFTGPTADAIGLAALRERCNEPPRGDVPSAVEAALRKGLRAEPSARHASVRALADVLDRAMPSTDPSADPSADKHRGWLARWRRRRR